MPQVVMVSSVLFALYYLCFLRVQYKPAFSQSFVYCLFNFPGFRFGSKMVNAVEEGADV
jgi:hypothetical protein